MSAAHRTSTWLLFSILLCGLSAAPATALDGQVDYRDSRQDGGSAGADYSLQMLRREGILEQRLDLSRRLALRIGFRYLDEDTESEVDGVGSGWDALTRNAKLGLSFHGSSLRLNLEAEANRRDFGSSGAARTQFDRQQLAAWANLHTWREVKLQGSWLESVSRRGEDLDLAPDLHVRNQTLSVDLPPNRLGSLDYRFSRLWQEDDGRRQVDISLSHTLGYARSFSFADRRLNLGITARSRWFEQSSARAASVDTGVLFDPFAASTRIDSSPEVHDPLEDASESVPALFDRDLETPTGIELGDDAPAGWQIGGDYRNIVVDFGETDSLQSVVLYVAQRALTPELMTWRFFTSDDPVGSEWDELPAGVATARYAEWSVGRQGWSVTLSTPVLTRRFKLVNVKLGPVAPTLDVTELELFRYAADQPAFELSSRNDTQRFNATTDYRLGRGFLLRHDLGLRIRHFQDDTNDLTEQNQGLALSWRRSGWRTLLRHEWQRLDRGDARTTDVSTSIASAGHAWSAGHSLEAFASQVRDGSRDRDRVTNTVSLGSTLQLAPELRFDQRFSLGWLDDYRQKLESRSMTSRSVLRSAPTRWLNVDLTRVERWVEQSGGLGFSNFNDTTLSLAWLPVPRISFRSHLVYQVREDSDLLTRYNASWTPLVGGDLTLRLTGSLLSDTRSDYGQRSASVNVDWEPRSRLLLQSGLEYQRYERAGERSTPLNGFLRGSLRF